MNDPARFWLDEPVGPGASETESVSRRRILAVELTDVLPALNRRDAFAAAARRLSGEGVKAPIDVFAAPPRAVACAALPCCFRRRAHRQSKLDTRRAWQYPALLARLGGRAVPARFLLFAMIGSGGVATHLAVLRLAIGAFGVPFPAAQAIAAGMAMTGNFLLNNIFTYRDQRLRGRALARGLVSFYAVCAIGAAANVALAAHLFAGDCSWWLAGIGGAAIAAVWNYAMSSVLIWRSPRPANSPPRPPSSPGRRAATGAQSAVFGWAAD
jgi:dolichol-phosphate mannosyltransferase